MPVSEKQTIHNPHDKVLFNALKNHEVARDAMRAYLPEELLVQANLTAIKIYKTKLITPEFKEFQADILYEVPLEQQNGLFLFHCEQQSKVEKTMPLRIWQYLLLILMEYAENHPKKSLPIIYPIIIYTGELPYTESTNFFDLFGENKALAEKFLLHEVRLIDVCRMSDEDIKKHHLFGLSEYAFKYKKNKNFEKFIQEILPWMNGIALQKEAEYVKMILRYVIDVFPDGNYDLFVKAIENYKNLGGEAMTIAQYLENRGIKQGLQQGLQQSLDEKIESAKNLLKYGIQVDIIARSMKLPVETINELEKTIKMGVDV